MSLTEVAPRTAVLAATALFFGACDPGPEPADVEAATVWPAGTVLAVDEVSVSAEEVDEVAGWVRELYPEYTLPHARRLALTNYVLPRAAFRAQHAEELARALELCRAARSEIDTQAARATSVRGGLRAVGLPLWGHALRLETGVWSDPIELAGRWVLVRLEHHEPGPIPEAAVLELSLLDFPGGGSRETLDARVEAALDVSRLTLVDPDYAGILPEAWKRRMRAAGP